MLFAHDTELALTGAAALMNTDQPQTDLLPDVAALDAFIAEWGWTGSRRRDQQELDEVLALRDRLRALWSLPVDELAAEVNALLKEFRALPQLVTHGDWGYHLHAAADDAPLAERMAVEAGMGLVDVIRQGELDRLRTCDADDCGNVLVDLSKNRSRRYCSTACSNRMNVAAFRTRKAALGPAARTRVPTPATEGET